MKTVKFIELTQSEYDADEYEKNDAYIYFTTDTNEIYKGGTKMYGNTVTQASTATSSVNELSNKVSGMDSTLSVLGGLKPDTIKQGDKFVVTSQLNSTESMLNTTNGKVTEIEGKIPNAATANNQLADKDFVNSSIATNTANFKGTFNSSNDLPTTDVTPNDYAFVIETDSDGNTKYNRYKYTGTSWVFEYTLNNSSFTAVQWASIQSGITQELVAKLDQLNKTDFVESEKIVHMTQSEYDNMGSNEKQPGTLYFITEG